MRRAREASSLPSSSYLSADLPEHSSSLRPPPSPNSLLLLHPVIERVRDREREVEIELCGRASPLSNEELQSTMGGWTIVEPLSNAWCACEVMLSFTELWVHPPSLVWSWILGGFPCCVWFSSSSRSSTGSRRSTATSSRGLGPGEEEASPSRAHMTTPPLTSRGGSRAGAWVVLVITRSVRSLWWSVMMVGGGVGGRRRRRRRRWKWKKSRPYRCQF